MATLADQCALSVHSGAGHALAGMPIALATRAHGNIADGIEVGLQHLSIAEQFITKGIQAIQCDANISGCYPILQLQAALEIDATRTTLERGEGDLTIAQWRDVAVLAGAERMRLTFALANGTRIGQAVGIPADGTVELVGYPGAVLRGALVNRKGLRSWRTEENAHVGYVVRLT